MKKVVRLCACALLLAAFSLTALADDGVETLFSQTIEVGELLIIPTPEGLCFDAEGAMYIFDTANQLVYSYKDGAFTQIAGSGTLKGGYSDESALKSRFNGCSDGAFTNDGKLVILDKHNNILRALVNGEMFTFSGDATAGYAEGGRREAKYRLPCGLAASGGSVYVSDTLNHCIRVTNGLGDVRLFAGVPETSGYLDGPIESALFNEPVGLAIADDGAIYVCDSGNQRIRKIENGVVTTVAGGGEYDAATGYFETGYVDGADARFNFPSGLCWADGVLYIADSGNHAVRALTDDLSVVTLAGGGTPGFEDGADAKFNLPTDVAYYDGYIYIADSMNAAVRRVRALPR